jgi:hypothetical protein
MTTQAPQTLDHDQFQAVVKAARDRFAMLKVKHPPLKGYLVLSIPGKQTGIGSGAKEILDDLPALPAYAGGEPMRLLRRTSFAEYLEKIRPRLEALEAEESEPKVIPRIFEIWEDPEAFLGAFGAEN